MPPGNTFAGERIAFYKGKTYDEKAVQRTGGEKVEHERGYSPEGRDSGKRGRRRAGCVPPRQMGKRRFVLCSRRFRGCIPAGRVPKRVGARCAAAAVFAALLLAAPSITLLAGAAGKTQEVYRFTPQLESDGAVSAFRVKRVSTGKIDELSAFDYVCGVVAAEMPAQYDIQALSAQAAAAYTYACYSREYNRTHPSASALLSGADISDDFRHYQSYISRSEAKAKWGGSFDYEWGRIEQAVSAVNGKVVTYAGKPINAVFFAVSPGRTESSSNVWDDDLPYLRAVDSQWDVSSPDYRCTVEIKADALRKTALAKYSGLSFGADPKTWISVGKTSASGTVMSVTLGGKSITGAAAAQLFSLRSCAYSAEYRDGAFVFDIRGDGHDVGMSQYGAQCLALKGKNWEDIIKYYYTGVSIQSCRW
jgi:stage II sporulation protein D